MKKVTLIINDIDDVVLHHKSSIVATNFIHEHHIDNDKELRKVIEELTTQLIKRVEHK